MANVWIAKADSVSVVWVVPHLAHVRNAIKHFHWAQMVNAPSANAKQDTTMMEQVAINATRHAKAAMDQQQKIAWIALETKFLSEEAAKVNSMCKKH